MKKKFLTLFTILSFITMFGQEFEGKITYSNSFKSKNPEMTDQQLQSVMGSTQEFIIKDGDYKSSLNGMYLQWQLYINKDNKLYTKMSNSVKAVWNDGNIQEDVVIKVEINKQVIEILGYKCDEIILTFKNGVQKYYYNSKVSANSKLFTNHKYGNWYDYLSKTNALPLKTVTETDQFTMVSIATEITPMKLDSKLFELPSGMETEKSPY